MEEKKKIEMLVLDCIRRGKEPRRELVWLEEKYQRFAVENRLAGRAQTDALIYKKMYGTKPEKESHVLKIRFWRTGRRNICCRHTMTAVTEHFRKLIREKRERKIHCT